MHNSLTPRYLVILVILGWSMFSLWPTIQYQSLTDDEKEDLREEGTLDQIESQVIRQGLDLKGGMYIELEADIPTLIKNRTIDHALVICAFYFYNNHIKGPFLINLVSLGDFS